MLSLGSPWEQFAYISAFGLTTVACGAAAVRARKIEDAETRRGLVALLGTSCAWAFLQLSLLVGFSRPLAYGLYEVSLVAGLATVGAWLYFCSAYTGRSFHRNQLYRRGAVVTYLVIVGIKLTNPLHNLYFTAELATEPFVHLAVRHGIAHWIVSGIAYSLSAVGLFMLYEMFLESNYDTRPLTILAALTALPVTFDIVGYATTSLLDINYESLGVAVFAVGVLYVFEDRFFAVQLADDVEEPVVHLGPEGQIHEVNDRARKQFSPLVDAAGESLASVFPAAADRLDSTDRILEWDDDGESRYYLVSEVSATLGQTDIVRTVVFTDVTETEAQRRELERHNAQLEGFAAAIRHNLLNTLQVIRGRLSHASETLEDGDVQAANESLVKASNASQEMSETVGDLATLAREGRTIEELQRISFAEAVRDAAAAVETDGTEVSVRRDGVISADGSRLRELLKNALTFAVYNEASTITLSLRDDGFEISDDGRPPEAADVEQFFQYGEAQPDSDTGMILPNLEMLARTQGWKVTVDTDHRDGFRLVVTGATTDPQSAATGEGTEIETTDSAES